MTQAIRDNNHVPVWLGVLFSDPTVTVPIAIDGSGRLTLNQSDSIAFTPDQVAIRDENFRHVLMAVDSTDETKLCPVFVDSNGAVLVSST
jgi:hypothetical protein